jgi:signal transduction histidine kinase
LEITKIETGMVTVNAEQIDIYQLVAELESDYAMVSKEKSVSVNWRVPAGLPKVLTDRMKLRQVLINLVNNAIKFTDQGSVDVCFCALADEAVVEFRVRDTGIGIAEEFLPHIFEKFRQIDSTTTRHYSGAGLGLYVVKIFVEVLGGVVSVQSKPDEGTTFTVRVPVGAPVGPLEDDLDPRKTATEFVAQRSYKEGEL